MSFNLSVDSSKIPLWKGLPGSISVDLAISSPDDPIPLTSSSLARAHFDTDQTIHLAAEETVALEIAAKLDFSLIPIWKEKAKKPDLAEEFDLNDALTPDTFLLAMDLGGKSDLTASGSFPFHALTIGGTLALDASGRFVAIRRYGRTEPAQAVLEDFFRHLALPGSVTAPPDPGEHIALEFGGYLQFGADAALGFSLAGTPSTKLSEIALSEKYDWTATGKLSLAAKIAGNFSVEVRSAADPHWARVIVHRRRAKDFSVAADLAVEASLTSTALPASGEEFVGALLGLRAQNWFHMAQSALGDPPKPVTAHDLQAKLDPLSELYLSEFAGKSIPDCSPADIDHLLIRLEQVVDSAHELGPASLILLERYFTTVESTLKTALLQLRSINSWQELPKDLSPTLWNILMQLTDGDLPAWTLGVVPATGEPSFPVLQKRVAATLSLLTDDLHHEARVFLALSRQHFSLDAFLADLQLLDSPAAIVALLPDRAKAIAERLLGLSVDHLDRAGLQDAFQSLTAFAKALRNDAAGFLGRFDDLLRQAAVQSFTLDLNSVYSHSTESKALIDVELRLLNDNGTPCVPGQTWMRQAGLGNFQPILSGYDPALVRIHAGALTHQLSSSTAIKINVIGWHQSFHYNAMHKVVVDADQHIRPTPAGMLNVFTTAEVSSQHDTHRKTSRAEQELHSNFTLRFLAETRNVSGGAPFDAAHQQYLLDVITGQAASYTSTWSSSAMTPADLTRALAFARYLHLDNGGASPEALAPYLPMYAGNFGPVRIDYAVRFAEAGLRALFQTPVSDTTISAILRGIVVGNYGAHPTLSSAAWLFCSPRVRELATQPNFLQSDTLLSDALNSGQIAVQSPVPGVPVPSKLDSSRTTRDALVAFFAMETVLLRAFAQLEDVLHNPGHLRDLESRLDAFGKAMDLVERFAQSGSGNAISPEFALFDQLIALQTPAASARNSALAITAGAPPAEHHLLFQSAAQPAPRTLTAGG